MVGLAQALENVVQESVFAYVFPGEYVIYVLCCLYLAPA